VFVVLCLCVCCLCFFASPCVKEGRKGGREDWLEGVCMCPGLGQTVVCFSSFLLDKKKKKTN
jgi:hypothetical protein